MRSLVTGATGFVGSHLVRRLLKEGAQVAILIRPSSNPWRIADLLPGLTTITGDLTTIEDAADGIRDFAPEAIFHLAWHAATSFRFQDDPAQVFANLPGSLELVRLASELKCRRWIGMGSVLECGHYQVPHPENVNAQPKTLYGASKHSVGLLAEKLCRIEGIAFAWFRLFWAYGPGDDKNRLIPYLISALLRGERPALTPGEQRWDYLYVDDAVEALVRVARNPDAQGIFNLGSGQAYAIRDVAERIRDLIDPSQPLGLGDIPYRPDQIMHLQADMTRLRDATGWSPQVDLDEGMRRTVDWFRDNQ